MNVHTPVRAEQAQACDAADVQQALEFRRPTLYRAKLLRCRSYLSQRDADAYDEGVARFRSGRDVETINTPMSAGWFDAESVELDRSDRVFQA